MTVKYKTIEGTATEGTDFEKAEGTLTFDKDVVETDLAIKIMNDNAYEEEWLLGGLLDGFHPLHGF